MKRKIVIIGDSHTDAIKAALKNNQLKLGGDIQIKAFRFSKIKNGKQIGDISDDAVIGVISDLTPSDLVVSTIGGNQHQVVSLIQHPIPFDFFTTRSEGSNNLRIAGAHLIPYSTFFDYFWQGIANGKDGKRLRTLREHSNSLMVHLVPPPPKSDTDHILNNHETHFSDSGISEMGVSSPELRLNVWQLQVEVLKKIMSESDIGLLPPPQKSMDSNGFLAKCFYANDATHANKNYGELVVAQVIAYLEKINIVGVN